MKLRGNRKKAVLSSAGARGEPLGNLELHHKVRGEHCAGMIRGRVENAMEYRRGDVIRDVAVDFEWRFACNFRKVQVQHIRFNNIHVRPCGRAGA